MSQSRQIKLNLAVLLGATIWFSLPAAAQDKSTDKPTAPAAQAQESARQEIFASDRWRRMQRDLNEWLSIQTIYADEEVAIMRGEIRKQVAAMSPQELEGFMKDTEERLAVLLSPEAKDARLWLNQFLAVAANPEAQLGRPLPDVANMTASQIRQELLWLQQHRETRQQAHLAGARTRQLQAARQPVRPATPDRTAWPANNQTRPSRYAPQPELRPQPLTVSRYAVSPWGTPFFFNPLSDRW